MNDDTRQMLDGLKKEIEFIEKNGIDLKQQMEFMCTEPFYKRRLKHLDKIK